MENLPILEDFVPYRDRCPAAPMKTKQKVEQGKGNADHLLPLGYLFVNELLTNRRTDGPTDRRTDRRTDTPAYRDGWTHLKSDNDFLSFVGGSRMGEKFTDYVFLQGRRPKRFCVNSVAPFPV